ncbi:MAG: hypothetical protein Kow00105_06000 [Phycisphaeraceae bacterium]
MQPEQESSASQAEDPGGSPDPDPLEPTSHPDPDPISVTMEMAVDDCIPPAAGWLESQLGKVLRLAGVTEARLGLVVVDDARMSELHDQYLGDPTTTDVITFDMREDKQGPIEGDLVLCMDEARRQANRRGHDTRLELLLYAVHGFLHLLGEDDHTELGYERMHRMEDELLTRAGFGAVFNSG